MGTILGERIAFYRKMRGLTQEQLGQLVGVSSQAVSKWEKGGAPDVELLPSIADRLGVTIDGLFGRDAVPKEDMEKLLHQWLSAFLPEERMNQLFKLLASSHQALCSRVGDWLGEVTRSSLDSGCYSKIHEPGGEGEEKTIWLRSLIRQEEGIVLSVLSNELPLYLLLPEPPAGYAEHFADIETYRRFFAALSAEGSLEVLLFLHGEKQNYFTAGSIARRTGLHPEQVSRALQELEKCSLVYKKRVEIEDGAMDAWLVHDSSALVPFLYFVRWMMEADSWLICWETRKRPLLQKRNASQGEKSPEHSGN